LIQIKVILSGGRNNSARPLQNQSLFGRLGLKSRRVLQKYVTPPILSARSDDIPNLDVRPICRGIASQSADPLSVGLSATFEECMRSEQDVREQLKKEWPTFSAADKQHCVALAKTGGESSNTELIRLSGNGARCASRKVCRSRFLRGARGHDQSSIFALAADGAASIRQYSFAASF
jgi:hypothetical protein